MRWRATTTLSIAAALLLPGGCAAPMATQPPATVPLDHLPALKGDYFPLRSAAADHLYHIYVRLPQGYDAAPARRYPVVYLLDGDSLFPMLAPAHLFLTIDDKIPEAIVVGIAYGSFDKPVNRRHVDFMPPAAGVPAAESGAVAFQRFLKSELLPTVEARYRADPARRVLFGQSRGGAMILFSAFTDPDPFWAHVASNPSWVPAREMFFGPAPNPNRRDLHLIVASGTHEIAERRAIALEWFAAHQQRRDAAWQVHRVDIPGGTHSAYSVDAYRAAMRLLFGTPAK